MKRILFSSVFLFVLIILLFSETVSAQATLIHGSGNPRRYDLVFLGDGFTATQQTDYNNRVQDAVNALFITDVYRDHRSSFNIWRVNVVSVDDGIDHPVGGITRNTALNMRYGNPAAGTGEAQRCIVSDTPDVVLRTADQAPARNMIMVLVNDTQWGGCALFNYTTSSISPGFENIVAHEFGHAIGALADEYTIDGSLTYGDPEPWRVNCTASTRRPLKWEALVTPGTAIPTPDIAANAGRVGAFEGCLARFTTNIWRPQSTCKMRTNFDPFCAVCAAHMRTELGRFFDNRPPTANAGPDQTVDGDITVTLNGSGSSDPDGDPLTYSWVQTGGPSVLLRDSGSVRASFVVPASATGTTLVFQLTVNDGFASVRATVRVSVTNRPPVANAGPDQTVDGDTTVTLNGSGSSDPDGGALTYQWRQIGSSPTVSLTGATTSRPTFTSPEIVGGTTLTFRLTVTDPGGLSSSDDVVVSVRDGDPDRDGLLTSEERRLGTNPNNADTDGDGLSDFVEVRTHRTNPLNRDTDGDGINDGEEIRIGLNPNTSDNPVIPIIVSLLLEADLDNDGIDDEVDNCVREYNPTQANVDGDRLGDACDFDNDNDGVNDVSDCAPLDPRRQIIIQRPSFFGVYPKCMPDDSDDDDDGVADTSDNCPRVSNPMQEDSNSDGIGDACEIVF